MDKEAAKKILFDVADTLEEFGIQFFLSDGICLGAYRERDFIEYDDDVDLKAIAEDFIPKYPLLHKKLENKGYRLWNPVVFNVMRKKGLLPFQGIDRSFIDTRVAAQRGKSQLDICSLHLIGNARWQWGRYWKLAFPARLFDNPEKIVFLGREFNIPTPVTEYLEIMYGLDYMTPKRRGEYVRPEKFWKLCRLEFGEKELSEKLT